MGYLIDTNVLSELRKATRCDPRVLAWAEKTRHEEKFLSVLVLGEIRREIESLRRRDEASAVALERWLARLEAEFGARVLPVTAAIADAWGRMAVPDPPPAIDGLLAATARVHSLILITRNVRDVARTGVQVIDPFASAL